MSVKYSEYGPNWNCSGDASLGSELFRVKDPIKFLKGLGLLPV